MRRLRLVGFVLVAALVVACGVNPVTGKRELQFISEAQEIEMGVRYFPLTQQSEGGEFIVLPEISEYVSDVGQRLAAVADRELPYEFVVLNNSVPNAWALPGGKIAINRGLLVALENEAELAAVLGHEIVHAAARHGARAQERGTLLQAGLAIAQIGAAVGGVDSNVAGLMIGGASVGAQLIQTKYSRDQELEADRYGMRYMKAAGYDPSAAVTLQKTFVRLAEQGGRQQSWLEGLFASHPPSTERVDHNERTADELGRGGELGVERYRAQIAPLQTLQPAYDKHDRAVAAAQQEDYETATRLASEAVEALPSEGRFHQLLGDIAVSQEQYRAAIPHYEKAIELNPDFFGSYLGGGIAQIELGDRERGEEWLTKSLDLLPTAPAAYHLGNLARERGERDKALQYYKAAADSQSSFGRRAAMELVRMELPQNPDHYVAAAAQVGPNGRVMVVVENRAPVPITDIRVTPVLVDRGGRIVQQGAPVRISRTLAPQERAAGDAGIGVLPPEQLAGLRMRVDAARVAQ